MSNNKSSATLQTLGLSWTVVYDQHRHCLGHVLDRGWRGFEAFDLDDRSLGRFADLTAAADAAADAVAERNNQTHCEEGDG